MAHNFTGICLISSRVNELSHFYSLLFNSKSKGDHIFSYFKINGGMFSIFSTIGMKSMAPNSMKNALHGGSIIEFVTNNIISKYETLLTSYSSSLSEPQKNEHGEQILWLNDPDGNVIRLTEKNCDNNSAAGIQFEGISIMTNKLEEITSLYEKILKNEKKQIQLNNLFQKKLNLKIYNKVDIEFAIPFTINQMGGGSFTIEVRVPDIDQKYEVLKELNVEIVKEPTTQLWGRRSVWFRDQENNIINFYAPAPKIIK